MFRVQGGVANILPFFEVHQNSDGSLAVEQFRQTHVAEARRKFANISTVNAIDVQLLESTGG